MSFLVYDKAKRFDAAKDQIKELQRKFEAGTLGTTDEEKRANAFAFFQRNSDVMQASLDKFVTIDPDMLLVKTRVASIYKAHEPVLITGPTGTGKELLARAFTRPSFTNKAGVLTPRPFIAENCAGFPETLAESIFFGHRRGSFTGAIEDHVGLLESAGDGVVFLDEIGDMSITLQAKFLRAIQEHEIRRVGDVQSREINCRFIAATKYDLSARVATKDFREDLYGRLMTFPLAITGLRERPSDIKPILQSMLPKPEDVDLMPPFSSTATDYIHTYNVRALEALLAQWRRTGTYWI